MRGLCQRGESTGMGYHLHDLPIAVEKFSGETTERKRRETNRLRETNNKETIKKIK